MQTPVSVQDKKSFIRWFLNHYQLKKRESVWILNYIVNYPNLLENTHFVREAKYCPRGLIITSQCSEDVPFRFYKKQLVTTDAEKSFHDIRMNRQDSLYIQLNFKKSHQNSRYAAVLEENPFISDDYFITNHDKDAAKQILDFTIYTYRRTVLEKRIDYALDKRDRHTFFDLVDQLNHVDNSRLNQPDF
ncbi:ReoY family proteolytic degradation factor [Lentibacillus halophilus]|uniref:UPF0302 protein GCM10008983_22110 n=1 Tax=Lentibacillus halophilus TaxID=295065 RepID=A0ABN0ZDJ5_9BACI